MSELNELREKVLPCLLMLSIWTMTDATHASMPSLEFGRVSMQGSIINTPCAIATADLDQAIDMKVATVGEVIDKGYGQSHPFSFTLVNCTLDPAASNESYFRTTFDGASEDGLFRVNGARGVGLQITDTAGNIALPGKALPAGLLENGSQRLNYTLRLVRNHSPLKSGSYSAVLRFKVDYF